ncbi:kynurenine/alpha-aminoadipate aminotransferase, mitochondrial-like isoform X2 [Ptychodera flava]|uniref:kynurenine/alpha-aminoadipate aminotransferase, mitochondrial-like isoform X2 n=1 Tax=Ptychodera flava TaxID=63121 RepID=UPI00396A1243
MLLNRSVSIFLRGRKALVNETLVKDYNRFLNNVSLARKLPAIREMVDIQQKSSQTMISFAAGMPSFEMSPFQEATFKLKDGSSLTMDETSIKKLTPYTSSQGLPELVELLEKLQIEEHNPPTCRISCNGEGREMDLVVTTGNQDGLCRLDPHGCNVLGVDSDQEGMKPSHLREILSRWNPSDVSKPRQEVPDIPRILYLNPNGGNPTGAGLTMERKKEIYEIARNYNLLIIEDDPNYYVQFTRPRVPSFLSLDEDGRVIRLDSFSKVLSAAGLRLGFVTGPKLLLQRLVLHTVAGVLHSSSLPQILAFQLLNQWGFEGFRNYADEVSQFYLKKRNMLLAAAGKWLTGLAEWTVPNGGLFLWIKILGIDDTHKMITDKAIEKQVLLVPGNAFFQDSGKKSSYVRASFSDQTWEEMDEGMRRLAELIKEELKGKKED